MCWNVCFRTRVTSLKRDGSSTTPILTLCATTLGIRRYSNQSAKCVSPSQLRPSPSDVRLDYEHESFFLFRHSFVIQRQSGSDHSCFAAYKATLNGLEGSMFTRLRHFPASDL